MPYNIRHFFLILVLALFPLTHAQPSICSTGCLACNYASKTCTACDDGYQLSLLGTCFPTTPTNNCALFGATNLTCQQCKPTFLLLNRTCTKDYSGCLQYNSTACITCGYGTVLLNGTCSGTLNCEFFNSTCKNCTQGYLLNSGRCFYIQRDCAKIDINSGACSICAPGLTLVGFNCIKSIQNHTYCYLPTPNGCLACKIGFGLLNGKCILIPHCNSKQFLNASFQCQTFPTGCQHISPQSFNCTKCYPNYQLSNGTCLPSFPQHCSALSPTGDCLNCSSRYFPSNFKCAPVSIFCATYNTLGWCLTCSYTYFLNKVGQCTDPYCLNATANTCLVCRDYYRLDNATNRCLINDPHCTNSSDILCFSCTPGYYPSADLCLPLPPNCISADRTGHCLVCEPNHFLQLDRCYPTNTSLPHCQLYDMYSYNPQCTQCDTGYFVSLAKCTLIPPYCSLLLSNGQCAICLPNFSINNNQCLPPPNNPNPNCATIQNNTCLRCNSGYLLGSNSLCYPSAPNSCTSNDTSGACLECSNGNIPTRGGCIVASLVDINCKTYNGNVCQQCYEGYYLANNRCKLPNSDCSTFSPSSGGCLSCYPGYTLTNRQCLLLGHTPNCQAYDSRANCIACAPFYHLVNNTCQPVSPLCKNYNIYTGLCTNCYPGFSLVTGTCLQKTQPVWLNNNTQVPLQTCLAYNLTTGICAQCISGYYLQQARCLNYNNLPGVSPNCKTFINASYCLECYSGFSPILGQCSPIDPLCKTYNPTNSLCQTCYQGYNLLNGQCSITNGQQPTTCLLTNGSLCLKCIDNFILTNSTCIYNGTTSNNTYNIPYCTIAINQSHCALCSSGFYPAHGICYQVSPYCDKYNPDNGNCLTCKPQYIFANNTCLYPAMGIDTNCANYVSVYCAKCRSGYYLKNYVCQPIDPRCINFNAQINQCLQCTSGTPLFDQCQ